MATPADTHPSWMLPGTVIGLLERDGIQITRVALKPGAAVEIETEVGAEVRLGDPVLVEVQPASCSVHPDAPEA